MIKNPTFDEYGKTRFTESQIIKILREQEADRPIADHCRNYGIDQA